MEISAPAISGGSSSRVRATEVSSSGSTNDVWDKFPLAVEDAGTGRRTRLARALCPLLSLGLREVGDCDESLDVEGGEEGPGWSTWSASVCFGVRAGVDGASMSPSGINRGRSSASGSNAAGTGILGASEVWACASRARAMSPTGREGVRERSLVVVAGDIFSPNPGT
jgi:hypothetical protein